jgi:mannose-1-phosphate guanylyltransferase
LPRLSAKQLIAEPVGRNTAPAMGLAAYLLLRQNPGAVLGLFPSDHVIANVDRFRALLEKGVAIAAGGEHIVVLGIPPSRPETGYGYIEAGASSAKGVLRVRRFTEKPDAPRAAEFLRAGNYFWNSGMFLWSARTLTRALEEHLSKTAAILAEIASTYGSRKFDAAFRRLYPKCENISVDYALLEPRSAKGEQASGIFCLRADFGWNDLGSWTALYEHRAAGKAGANLIASSGDFALNASGNYIHAPGKFVAAVGVSDLVVVETEDALLITSRDRSQDVGKVVKYLDEKKLKKLT